MNKFKLIITNDMEKFSGIGNVLCDVFYIVFGYCLDIYKKIKVVEI
jgi:hypothetical protein